MTGAQVGDDGHTKSGDTPVSVYDEASKAWLTAFVGSPAQHRANAQAGYTVAAAVAAAVVGAGILASVDEAPWWVQAPAAISLGLWIYTAWMFMRAVAIQPDLGGVRHEDGTATLGEAVIQRTWKERDKVAKRSWAAQKWAFRAGVATLITVVAVMLWPSIARTDATVLLTEDGAAHVATLCGTTGTTIDAAVDLASLSDDIVVLHDVGCPDQAETLRLRKGDVAGVRGGSPNSLRLP